MSKVFASFFLASIFFLPVSALQAEPPGEDSSRELLRQVRFIQEKVKKIEAGQQEILNREEKILAELENLRVWIARR